MVEQKSFVYDAYIYAFKSFFAQFRLVALSSLASISLLLVPIVLFIVLRYDLLIAMLEKRLSKAQILFFIKYHPLIIMILLTISWFFIVWVLTGLNVIALQLYKNGTSTAKQIYWSFPHAFKLFIPYTLYLIIFLFGLCLFIVPGIIWSVRAGQFMYLILEKNFGALKAFEESFVLTKHSPWPLLGLDIVNSIILRTLILTPFITFTNVHVYHTLLKETAGG